MADMRGSGVTCDERCGCPSPCPGGTTCRCTAGGNEAAPGGVEHSKCSCGDHCGCNPCRHCPTSGGDQTATGKVACKCRSGCTCATCAA